MSNLILVVLSKKTNNTNLKVSLAAKPAKLTRLFFRMTSTMWVTCSVGTDISTPSSPVYPHLVILQLSTPHTFAGSPFMKLNPVRSMLTRGCTTDEVCGPCSAIKDRSSASINSTRTFFPRSLNSSYTKKIQEGN